jgi:hypothetical protein
MWLSQNVAYFMHFDNITLASLVKCLVQVKFKEDDTIIKKGDDGDAMFIILDGHCGVFLEERGLKHLTKLASVILSKCMK